LLNDTLQVRERKGEFVADCGINEASRYLLNVQNMSDWMHGVKEIVQIPSNDTCCRAYLLINLPWPFSDRDLCANMALVQHNEEFAKIRIVNEKQLFKRNARAIQIEHYDACWMLSGLTKRKTKVEFVTFSTEAPVFPQWMQEPVLKNVFLNNLRRLKDRLATK
jgi:hypothetical protein